MDKEISVYFPESVRAKIKRNAENHSWAREAKDRIVDSAKYWAGLSDDELRKLVFSSTLKRSWMVWSNGICANCRKDVPMYSWEIDAKKYPWKVRCPHCGEFFPKNDFYKFYVSGLDGKGFFDFTLADKTMLFNKEHPEPDDPLRSFGVDDGNGYVEGNDRWRFINCYLIYGQWKQLVLGGIKNLAGAYAVTGDINYARKAGTLLDRVADVYPDYDFKTQGIVYERQGDAGYVSTWHDACEETREMVMAYDMVFDGIKENIKIRRNVEERILVDALNNQHKIHSNYPRKEIAVFTIKTVLDSPDQTKSAYDLLDDILKGATAVDGVTGEKGLACYSAGTIQGVARLLGQLTINDSVFLKNILNRHPRIHDMFRFHIDTWCLEKYYPLVGDGGSFGAQIKDYMGVPFERSSELEPSMFTFLYNLYEATGDCAFVQVLHKKNNNSVDGLPYDIYCENPEDFRNNVKGVIEKEGNTIKLKSVNKQEWRVAVLRSGEKENARALWLCYETGESYHSHRDGMNVGLFAKGLSLIPDFGYPPVNYGGWESPRALWYNRVTSSHNTVVVDGENHEIAKGKTTLWADGKYFHAIRADCPEMIKGKRYERTLAMIDVSDDNFYCIDVFRVAGGKDHAKFLHGYFGELTTSGLSLTDAEEFGHGAVMHDFKKDVSPQPGWRADWKINDYFKYLPENKEIHFRHTDFTPNAHAYTCSAWIVAGEYNSNNEHWINSIMTRRQGQEPLSSAFVGIMEAYEENPSIKTIKRLPICAIDRIKPGTGRETELSESFVCLEITLAGGQCDVVIIADAEMKNKSDVIMQRDWKIQTDAELCLVRFDKNKTPVYVSFCNGMSLEVNAGNYSASEYSLFFEQNT